MKKNIFVNYAHEDREIAWPVVQGLKTMGLPIITGSSGEEKISGCGCMIHILTQASPSSKSFKKAATAAIRQAIPAISVKAGEDGAISGLFDLAEILATVMKYRYEGQTESDTEADHIGEKPEVASGLQEDHPEVIEKSDIQAEQAETDEISDDPEEPAKTDEASKDSEKHAETPDTQEKAGGKADSEADADEENILKSILDLTGVNIEELSKEDCYAYAMAYLNGQGVDADEVRAVELLRSAAHKGHVEAQYELCSCYDQGRGVRRNMIEAAKWCEMAAYGGHAKAQCEIGYCYEYGQGVVRNMKAAVRWYQAASDQGNIDAKNNLAFCYQKARGVAKDMKMAIKLYQEAAAGGHASAQYNLGFCYWYGEGVGTDKERAVRLFNQSAANGNAKAAQMLKILNQHLYLRS